MRGIYIYIWRRYSNDANTRTFYIKYYKILINVIKDATIKQHYSRLIAKSGIKIKTARNTIKREAGKTFNCAL